MVVFKVFVYLLFWCVIYLVLLLYVCLVVAMWGFFCYVGVWFVIYFVLRFGCCVFVSCLLGLVLLCLLDITLLGFGVFDSLVWLLTLNCIWFIYVSSISCLLSLILIYLKLLLIYLDWLWYYASWFEFVTW